MSHSPMAATKIRIRDRTGNWKTDHAEVPWPVLVSIAPADNEYALILRSAINVKFRTLDELKGMLPPFRAQHERGYEFASGSSGAVLGCCGTSAGIEIPETIGRSILVQIFDE